MRKYFVYCCLLLLTSWLNAEYSSLIMQEQSVLMADVFWKDNNLDVEKISIYNIDNEELAKFENCYSISSEDIFVECHNENGKIFMMYFENYYIIIWTSYDENGNEEEYTFDYYKDSDTLNNHSFTAYDRIWQTLTITQIDEITYNVIVKMKVQDTELTAGVFDICQPTFTTLDNAEKLSLICVNDLKQEIFALVTIENDNISAEAEFVTEEHVYNFLF